MKSRLEKGLVYFSYDHPKHWTEQTISLAYAADGALTSVRAADVELARWTAMSAVRILDFNLHVIDGATSTGAAATTAFAFTINKSLGGTGALSALGTAQIGTAANNSVVDASVTETALTAGDDLVFNLESGTALPASSVKVRAVVQYREQFEA